MSEPLRHLLKPIQRRQHWTTVLRVVSWGLLIGGLLALTGSLLRAWGAQIDGRLIIACLAAGLGAGLLIGLLRKRSWSRAAAAVDDHYRLKDRVISALRFAQRDWQGKQAPLYELQFADALEKIEHADARQVAPIRLPRLLPVALVVAAGAVGLLLVSFHGPTVEARPAPPLDYIKGEADYLQETMLQELRELLEEQEDPELDALVEELDELVEELGEAGVDERAALAKLSEMQMAIAQMQNELNVEAVDAQMKSIGEALRDAQATKAAAAALGEGDYDKAAEQLEQLEPEAVSRREGKGLSEKLKQLVQSMQAAGQQQLGEASSQMAEGLQQGDSQQCKEGASQLAGLCRKQGLRKSISQCLGNQLGRLAQCKGNCTGKGQKNGGKNVAQSERPSNNWGRGASGNPFGEQATSLEAERDRVDLSGQHGEGPSEKETLHTPEARQQAQRSYQEAYQKYRKMAEAVTEGEALPLGHRQVIRRYFEAIRPENDDETGDDGSVLDE